MKLNFGGSSNQLLQLIKSYEKLKNIKISIVTKYSEYKSFSGRVKIYHIHKFNNYRLDTIFFIIKSFLKILEIHKKDPIDVFNINGHPSIIISPFMIRLIFKIPILMKIPTEFSVYVNQLHLLEQQKFLTKIINFSWFKYFKVFLLRRLNFIRPINDKMLKDLINLNYPEKNIIKVPNGIDSKNLIDLRKKEHQGIYFGFVGRLTEIKNLRFLLDVFKTYFSKFPLDKLLIYGKGTEGNFISNFINNNNLNRNIKLLGFEEDKRKIYSTIDVLVNPSFGEGISNVVLEAMCTKTFVIASNIGGNRELIKHEINGLLFSPYKKEDLFNQLFYFKENKDNVQQMVVKSYKEVITNYDIDIIANKIYSFLKTQLISRK